MSNTNTSHSLRANESSSRSQPLSLDRPSLPKLEGLIIGGIRNGLTTSAPQQLHFFSKIAQGSDSTPRAEATQATDDKIDQSKIGTRLFKQRDRFLHILDHLERSDFKKLRRICKAGYEAFETDYQASDPIGKFWENSRVSFPPHNWVKDNANGRLQFELCARHKLKSEVFFHGETGPELFLEFLSYIHNQIKNDSFVTKAQNLESFDVSLSNAKNEEIFKSILSIVCQYPTIFVNLRCLKSHFSNLTNLPIPSSIESFKSVSGNTRVDICDKNFKSITLDRVHAGVSFKMEKLLNLESITIKCLHGTTIINAKEVPKLKYININDKAITIASIEGVITLEGYRLDNNVFKLIV